ncbi:MAG: serine/threonine-protein kinase [Planctomycetota bacterium]|nr:serine/threonine-protein kinase [Planctomycetota bacterium]
MAGKLQEVFEHVVGLERAEREAYLDTACGGDAVLRAEVEALLRAHDGAANFMASPTADSSAGAMLTVVTPSAAATVDGGLREGPGSRIGPYKVLQLIGEGGFGSVFMAEQAKPVLRKVALKIIKLGMDTRQVVARFEQERQALAMMDHPNIARVLDAGATDTGRPFFVMELVKGDPIVEYCDKHNLSIEDRLELFAQVCNAVQHAHTKGIIHRDIKPSNVLVSTQDGKPHAKVIDFGIAKATASKLTEKTLFTEHRQLIGTPEYMSPEQAEGSLDIDTRTDVYSLGVLLYELLTGTTPFSSNELRSAAYAEIQRIIREVEPPKPSTRLSQNADTIASIAAKRQIEPRRLGTLVRGELDWIVMKALEKDRQRRYETPSGLAADISRYLSGEAVVAAPPSNAYRVKKFVARNKGPVLAGSAVAAALIFGLAGTAWQAKVASEQRDVALAAQIAEADQRRQAELARAEALEQKARAEANEAEARLQKRIAEGVVKFQSDMLAAVDPFSLPKDPKTGEPLKDRVTVLQALEAALNAIDEGSLDGQPLVEAGVRSTIGNTLLALGRYQEALPVLQRALELRRASTPGGSLELSQSLDSLASIHQYLSKHADAVRLYREALEMRQRFSPAGDPLIGIAMGNLGQSLWALGEFAEAESLLRGALAIELDQPSKAPGDRAHILDNLAKVLTELTKLDEAEQHMRAALDLRIAAFPPGHPEIAMGEGNLATVLIAADRHAEAEPLLRSSLAIRRAAYSANHPEVAVSVRKLAAVLRKLDKLAEAEPLYREALAIDRATLPAGHPSIAASLNGLGLLMRDMKKDDEAEPLYREALAIRRAALPAGHTDIGTSLNNLAALLRDQGKLDEAEPLYRESLAIRRESLPSGHPSIALALHNLANLLGQQNKPAEAEPLFREAIKIRRAALPAGNESLVNSVSGLCGVLQAQGKFAEAEPLAEELLAGNRATLPAGHEKIANAMSTLAAVRHGLGKAVEARAGWDEAIAILRARFPNGSAQLARALWCSGSARFENNELSAARAELEEAVAMGEKALPPNHPYLRVYTETLAKCRAAGAK